MIVRHGRVCVAVERGKTVDVLPHAVVVCVKDVRAVFVHLNACYVLGVDISAHVGAFVDDEDTFARLLCLLSESSPKQPRTDDQIIVFHHLLLPVEWIICFPF